MLFCADEGVKAAARIKEARAVAVETAVEEPAVEGGTAAGGTKCDLPAGSRYP